MEKTEPGFAGDQLVHPYADLLNNAQNMLHYATYCFILATNIEYGRIPP